MLRDGAPTEREAPRAHVIEALDAFQAAERAGGDAMARWIAVCRQPRLRGGLRVIRARDLQHAALAEARLRALGGAPAARISRELAGLCGVIGHPEISDRSKLAMLLGRFPAQAPSPLADLARRLGGDAETQALLETINDDEVVALEWLREMSRVLEREDG
ncbi:MAG TPA: hypothetical protein VFD84_04315 [Candidatus Binatia bacterium]|jgi:hypothetical protein|nr:hypothetical protein [Candidatus Binatia bacterium]